MAHHYEHFWLDPKFWVGIAFVLFVVLTGRMLWQRLAGMLDARARAVRNELDEAGRLRAEAEALRQQAEAERTAAAAEAGQMIARAKAEAERLAKAAMAEAEASAKRSERMALDRIAAAEASAVAEVRRTAAEVATQAARDVIAEKFDARADAALVDRSVAELPKALRAA
ncbi:ATP synthase B chain [Roseomonas mucosa]|uniref:F0F1 ATP synthase subunit B family protein n=1 Tax=Roseomonas TaxID=125216 RepID=UPI000C193EDD|nr:MULTISPECIES: F0F1 ATP synthase subunit B [Roseomonas]ATR22646.1 F0F1 ATP synthase subunit B [Roseomonas sp. FDAARGOS_362]QDJ11284.1 ATP synthase B chain [Roseomonas mucosa]UZO98600.1 ATP synthase B chain [Roseomonas mucosa]